MTAKEFNNGRDRFIARMVEILDLNGADRSNSYDRLAEFKRMGVLLGTTPIRIWAVYAMKHMDAIISYAGKGVVENEEIINRFLDLANYAVLGAALVQEAQTFKPNETPVKTEPPLTVTKPPMTVAEPPTTEATEFVPPWLLRHPMQKNYIKTEEPVQPLTLNPDPVTTPAPEFVPPWLLKHPMQKNLKPPEKST